MAVHGSDPAIRRLWWGESDPDRGERGQRFVCRGEDVRLNWIEVLAVRFGNDPVTNGQKHDLLVVNRVDVRLGVASRVATHGVAHTAHPPPVGRILLSLNHDWLLLELHLLPLPLLVKRRTNRGGPMLGVAPRHDRETAESWSYVDHRPRHDLSDCAATRPVLDLILTGRAGT